MARSSTPRRRRATRSEDPTTVTTPRAGPAQAPAGKTAEGARRKNKRNAVIVVHGMGEQRPLETLRSFFEAVWDEKSETGGAWLVPDNRTGLSELSRITTRAIDGVRTDFYELYWSDLLVGNTLSQFRAWVRGLLWRWPHQVPRESALLWVGLWLLVLAVLGLAAFAALYAAGGDVWSSLFQGKQEPTAGTGIASAILGAVVFYALVQKLRTNWRRRPYANEKLQGVWAKETPAEASVRFWWSVLVVIAGPIAVALAALYYFPWSVLCDLNALALMGAAGITFILGAWVVPVFGDVARYVRTSPDAVAARADIRERGVELLRALHGPVEGEPADRYDHGQLSSYNRIVVVGHSLGSIIAYDVLRMFWEERGPTRLNPAGDAAMKALEAVDAFCREAAKEDPEQLDTQTYRDLQHEAAVKLAADPQNWRVTDFITLGSPLTHAEFLVSRDRELFERRKAERLFPICPPMMELGRQTSFLYKPKGGTRKFAHHAAMFSTMRWTNIHNPSQFILAGDFISGPCAPNFGPGIVDVAVSIRRGGLFSRLVTHTDYWNAEATAYASDEDGAKLGLPNISLEKQAHIELLKAALDLKKTS